MPTKEKKTSKNTSAVGLHWRNDDDHLVVERMMMLMSWARLNSLPSSFQFSWLLSCFLVKETTGRISLTLFFIPLLHPDLSGIPAQSSFWQKSWLLFHAWEIKRKVGVYLYIVCVFYRHKMWVYVISTEMHIKIHKDTVIRITFFLSRCIYLLSSSSSR